MTDEEKEMFVNLSHSALGKVYRQYLEKQIREFADIRNVTSESLQSKKDAILFIENSLLNPLKIMSGEVDNNVSEYN